MNEIRRLVLFNQSAKAFKPLVTGVFGIVDMPRGRMGNHHINPSPPPEDRSKPANDGTHLPLLVLAGTAIVPARSLQAENIYSVFFYQPAVQIATACRRFLVITNVMVAADVIKGGVKGMGQTGKVFRWKVATGNNQVDIRKRAVIGLLEKYGLSHV
jgi:hypothetical protein